MVVVALVVVLPLCLRNKHSILNLVWIHSYAVTIVSSVVHMSVIKPWWSVAASKALDIPAQPLLSLVGVMQPDAEDMLNLDGAMQPKSNLVGVMQLLRCDAAQEGPTVQCDAAQKDLMVMRGDATQEGSQVRQLDIILLVIQPARVTKRTGESTEPRDADGRCRDRGRERKDCATRHGLPMLWSGVDVSAMRQRA